jgi:hypothetical protein
MDPAMTPDLKTTWVVVGDDGCGTRYSVVEVPGRYSGAARTGSPERVIFAFETENHPFG